jgi:hypothetical protein
MMAQTPDGGAKATEKLRLLNEAITTISSRKYTTVHALLNNSYDIM